MDVLGCGLLTKINPGLIRFYNVNYGHLDMVNFNIRCRLLFVSLALFEHKPFHKQSCTEAFHCLEK